MYIYLYLYIHTYIYICMHKHLKIDCKQKRLCKTNRCCFGTALISKRSKSATDTPWILCDCMCAGTSHGKTKFLGCLYCTYSYTRVSMVCMLDYSLFLSFSELCYLSSDFQTEQVPTKNQQQFLLALIPSFLCGFFWCFKEVLKEWTLVDRHFFWWFRFRAGPLDHLWSTPQFGGSCSVARWTVESGHYAGGFIGTLTRWDEFKPQRMGGFTYCNYQNIQFIFKYLLIFKVVGFWFDQSTFERSCQHSSQWS